MVFKFHSIRPKNLPTIIFGKQYRQQGEGREFQALQIDNGLAAFTGWQNFRDFSFERDSESKAHRVRRTLSEVVNQDFAN